MVMDSILISFCKYEKRKNLIEYVNLYHDNALVMVISSVIWNAIGALH